MNTLGLLQNISQKKPVCFSDVRVSFDVINVALTLNWSPTA